ncbi:alpha/beta hydrolase [Novosphingobium mangrovi (ex Huang et al. 2023)]|uniref:Alpha/beta hydrolase n=1 Tax=Novosphingobium mangrovi (ex Huang et al. 2023) TaxID=2976432 RepID=A0ABT2I4B9_9SPHN|nr:alpha/beta hydrolase [Novosphingobium mangrovi (ex Huang et al. 2023)]MCT2399656.1 alpha/beta hydrolase [Novosphingobium mangrovi (ex Huang et al. 2023)]
MRRTVPADARETTWHAADGHGIRRLDWPAPADARRGSLLFMPGRADTYEKWLETLAEWHREGWGVTSADWRGQSYSGRLGRDALTGHIDDFATWVDDYAALWADWAARTPPPHVAVAHSMGGHIVLRAVTEGKVRPDALVLSAPMLGLHPDWMPSSVLHVIARMIAGLGDPRRPAWSGNEKPQVIPHSRYRLLTHDLSRYEDEEWWRTTRPAILMGAASWGWIERALASIRLLEAPDLLEAVDVPTLILATRKDGLVSWAAVRRAAARLPKAELVAFGKECRHEILREVDPVRDRAINAIREFLDRVVPARG